MTTAQVSTGASTSASRTGLYLAVLQLMFTLGWTTYVVYLPKLAADVGLAPAAVILILMLDQAIFTIADTAMGIAADKLGPVVGRLGLFVGVLAAAVQRAAAAWRVSPCRSSLVRSASAPPRTWGSTCRRCRTGWQARSAG